MVFQPKRKASTFDYSSPKRRRKICPVDQIPADILKSIFKRLDFVDIVRARAVCSSWNSLGEEFVSRTPWLMLPSKEEVEGGDGTDINNNAYSGFLRLGESQVSSLKKIPKEFRESCCIGSSNGWLVFLGEKAVPSLFHPFRQVKIQLPSLLDGVLRLRRMERNAEGEYEVNYFHDYADRWRGLASPLGKQELRELLIRKAILIGEPDCNNEKYGVVLLCKDGRIAYHKSGDRFWTEVLDVTDRPYQDIICHENHLFALSYEGNNIEIWDFQGGYFTKRKRIFPPFPEKSLTKRNSFGDLCSSRFYLVESCGDILLVVRFIGEYVDSNGKLLDEGDILNDDSMQPMVYPYRTCLFHVYKLDINEQKWVEMESLDDRALFLGGNQSVSVSAQSFSNGEGNSIYYTDDYWNRMEEDYLYGGHDMGIYNLKDGSVKPIVEFSSEKIQPPPCWIIPNPKPC